MKTCIVEEMVEEREKHVCYPQFLSHRKVAIDIRKQI